MSKIYGSAPIKVAEIGCDVEEMFFYQYLPIRIPHKNCFEYVIPPQLLCFENLIEEITEDFFSNICEESFDLYNEYYIYLTAKNLYVKGGENLNRAGWHCDGFMSDDINYIWCDCIPTEYVTGEYELIQDHEKSINQMNRLFYKSETLKCEPNTLYRLDETVIHRCDYNHSRDAVLRCFVKVSFSKEKYNLKGNSHNYLLNYDWKMKARGAGRNHPVK